MSRGPSRRQRVVAQREQLLLRSAALREQMMADAQVFRAPMAAADRAGAALNWLARHPEWPLAGLALIVVLRPRVLFRWAGRAVWAWQFWRRAGPLSRRIYRALDTR